MYTAVGNLLPAQGFIPPVETRCVQSFLGDVLKCGHNRKKASLCTPFMYTAVGNLLPAQGFIPPVETTLLFCFKFGDVRCVWSFFGGNLLKKSVANGGSL